VKEKLVGRILRKGYLVSVDDGRALLVHQSNDFKVILAAMKGLADLLWIYNERKDKLGWMKVNSRTGTALDYSTRDSRVPDIVAGEFITERRKR
jgi:hypothetical protein